MNAQKFKQTEIGKIPEDWIVEPFGNLIKLTTGKLDSNAEEADGKYPFFTCAPVPLKINNYAFDCDAILLAGNNANGIFHINKFSGKFNAYQRTYILTKKEDVNLNFLYYSLQLYLNHFREISQGSATKFLTRGIIEKIKIGFPKSSSEQLAIASILSSLDSKIELNNKMNKTLEAIGQAIFKKWFIDERKEDWKISKIGSELKTILGGTPDRTKPEYWNGDINWINSGKVNELRIIEPSEKITELGLKKSATSLLPKGTVVLAITGATLGQVSRLEINSCANQSVIGVLENEKFSSEYLYYLIKNKIDEIIGFQTGGAQQHINKNNVDNFEIIIPDEKTLRNFNQLIKPIFKQISINSFQSQTLSQIRDALLPKLMSGEIRVK